ncbi:hypothetical protein PybrP1_009975 [[Pythium] brassicae (nom. inval.)]|nr:hypothetical protein PybrP1_009975 [[Pythium] brassicae (nom. inval.)]
MAVVSGRERERERVKRVAGQRSLSWPKWMGLGLELCSASKKSGDVTKAQGRHHPPTHPHDRPSTTARRSYSIHRLRVCERRDARQLLALEQLEARAAACRDVAHLRSEPRLLDCRHRVAAAHDRRRAARRALRERVRDAQRALGERWELEHAHGAVPHDRAARAQLLLKLPPRLWADVQAHPVRRDHVRRHRLNLRVRREPVRHHHVGRQEQLHAAPRGFVQDLARQLHFIILDHGLADVDALPSFGHQTHAGRQVHKVVATTTSTTTRAAPLSQNHPHAHTHTTRCWSDPPYRPPYLSHLGASDDRAERPLRRVDSPREVLELLLHEKARDARADVLRHARGGRVRAVRSAERVVDKHVGAVRELLGERRVVLRLLLVEAHVLEQHDVAVGERVDVGGHTLANAVVQRLDGPAEQLAQALAHRCEA